MYLWVVRGLPPKAGTSRCVRVMRASLQLACVMGNWDLGACHLPHLVVLVRSGIHSTGGRHPHPALTIL